MPQLIHNDVNIDKIYHNGVEVKEVYHNGVKVFPDWIEVPNAKNNALSYPTSYSYGTNFFKRYSWTIHTPPLLAVTKTGYEYFVKIQNHMIRDRNITGYGIMTFGNLLPTTKDIEQVKIRFKTLDYDNVGANIQYHLYLPNHKYHIASMSLPTTETSFNSQLDQGADYTTNAFVVYNGSDFEGNIQKELIVTFKNQQEHFLKSLGIAMVITIHNWNHLTPAGLQDLELYYKLKGQ